MEDETTTAHRNGHHPIFRVHYKSYVPNWPINSFKLNLGSITTPMARQPFSRRRQSIRNNIGDQFRRRSNGMERTPRMGNRT
jgi:hypothetical protein